MAKLLVRNIRIGNSVLLCLARRISLLNGFSTSWAVQHCLQGPELLNELCDGLRLP